jgi:hypothetical protein
LYPWVPGLLPDRRAVPGHGQERIDDLPGRGLEAADGGLDQLPVCLAVGGIGQAPRCRPFGNPGGGGGSPKGLPARQGQGQRFIGISSATTGHDRPPLVANTHSACIIRPPRRPRHPGLPRLQSRSAGGESG